MNLAGCLSDLSHSKTFPSGDVSTWLHSRYCDATPWVYLKKLRQHFQEAAEIVQDKDARRHLGGNWSKPQIGQGEKRRKISWQSVSSSNYHHFKPNMFFVQWWRAKIAEDLIYDTSTCFWYLKTLWHYSKTTLLVLLLLYRHQTLISPPYRKCQRRPFSLLFTPALHLLKIYKKITILAGDAKYSDKVTNFVASSAASIVDYVN